MVILLSRSHFTIDRLSPFRLMCGLLESRQTGAADPLGYDDDEEMYVEERVG